MNTKQVYQTLVNEGSDRADISHALAFAAQRISQHVGRHSTSTLYISGSGYDFSQFARPIANDLAETVQGIACLWTEPCEIPDYDGDRVFSFRQEFVEPAADSQNCTLLVCCSIISDKMEPLTHLIRIAPTVRPKKIIIAAAIINSKVRADLRIFLRQHFGANSDVVCDFETSQDLRRSRSSAAERLDNREVKVFPVMSEWLLRRRFGPRPKPTLGYVW